MTLEEFATSAGVRIVPCDPDLYDGAEFGYTEIDHPNITYCGYKSKQEVYETWLAETFNPTIAAALMKLLTSEGKTMTTLDMANYDLRVGIEFKLEGNTLSYPPGATCDQLAAYLYTMGPITTKGKENELPHLASTSKF
jgi:hypothetical protein